MSTAADFSQALLGHDLDRIPLVSASRTFAVNECWERSLAPNRDFLLRIQQPKPVDDHHQRRAHVGTDGGPQRSVAGEGEDDE